ncbi:MAG: NAD-dependent epimerase/dehydratase family protein [Phycisphaeraceae bacterium]
MKLLLTGAAGRLGSRVCRELDEAGHEVVAVDRQYTTRLPVPVELVDLLEAFAPYRLLEGCDGLIHLAGHPNIGRGHSLQQVYGENVTMAFNLFQAASDVGVKRIVFSSSVQVVAGRRHPDETDQPSSLAYLPIDGGLPARPGNAYALSKQACEQMLAYHASLDPELSATAVRFPALPDPGRARRWFSLRNRMPVGQWQMHADEGFAYLWVGEAARLTRLLIENQTSGYHQYLPAMPDNVLGWPAQQVIETFYRDVPGGERVEESLVDNSALLAEVGWQPTAPTMREVLAEAEKG